jgi:hypothetical protein
VDLHHRPESGPRSLSRRRRRFAGSRSVAEGGGPDPHTVAGAHPLRTGPGRLAGSPSVRGERSTRSPGPFGGPQWFPTTPRRLPRSLSVWRMAGESNA